MPELRPQIDCRVEMTTCAVTLNPTAYGNRTEKPLLKEGITVICILKFADQDTQSLRNSVLVSVAIWLSQESKIAVRFKSNSDCLFASATPRIRFPLPLLNAVSNLG